MVQNRFLKICILAVLVIGVRPLIAETYAVKEWNGEYFKKREGAMYVKTVATGFSKPSPANIQLTFYGIIQQKFFTFSNTQSSAETPETPPRQLWKFNSGKYRLERIDFIDGDGVKRSWSKKADEPVVVVVPRVMVSNLGQFTIAPVGARDLTLTMKMLPNSYKEASGNKKDSSVAAVVNGITGSIQKVVGGKQTLDGADHDYSDEKTLRASTSFTRQISMFYKINLFRHNQYSKDLMAAFAAFDLNLRTCYVKALNAKSDLKGDVVIQILVSEKTGTIRQIHKSKGSITDGAMIDCLLSEIQQIPMPVQQNMIGELTFMFDTK